MQWVAEHFFDGPVGAVGLVIFAAASSVPEQYPVGRTITSPTKARGIDEGLRKVNRVAVHAFPIIGKSRRHTSQNVRRQMENPDPGQNQKARIVGNEADIAPPRFRTPADVAIPAAQVPRC